MSEFQPLDLAGIAGEAGINPTSDVSSSEVQLPSLQPSVDLSDPAELGYQEGIRSGLQQVEEQTRGLLSSLGLAAQEFDTSRRQALRDLENQAALLAYDLACALADAYIEANPESIQAAARGALGEVSEAETVVLFVHPDDLGLLDAELLSQAGQHLVLRADPHLERGGCRVESPIGDVDATRQGRREYLRERVNEIISERQT